MEDLDPTSETYRPLLFDFILMFSALIWTGRSKPAFTIRVTHLGKASETQNCVHQTKLQLPANGPTENAAGFLLIPAPSW